MPCHSNCQDTPTPWGRRPPNGGHTGSGRAPDPAGSHLGVSAAPRSGPEGESPPWGHVSSPIPRPCSISGEGSCAGGKARCTELAGWKQGHGAVGAVRSHACPPLPGNPLAISTGGHTRCLGGGAAGAPMLLSPPADQECSVGLCDHSILFFTDLDLRGGGLSTSPHCSTAQLGATQCWEMMPPLLSAPSPAATPPHRAPALWGSASPPTPEKPMVMLWHGRGLLRIPRGSAASASHSKAVPETEHWL